MPSPYSTSNSAVLNGGAILFLTTFDLGTVADSLITVLNGLDTADVHTYGRVELQCLLPPVVVSGLPKNTPIFSRNWLMKMAVVPACASAPVILRNA